MAARLLLDLPSRGCFSSTTDVSMGDPRLYICDHDTSPPEHQVIKTDSTNILIRSLTMEKELKGKEKQTAGSDSKKTKRPAEKITDERIVPKRANTGSGLSSNGRKESGQTNSLTERDFQGYTVGMLRSMLKERGLPQTGKKGELIARLKQNL